MKYATLFVVMVGLCSPVAGADAPATWPQWRGPDRTSTVAGDWPDALGEAQLKQVWQVDLAEGYSSPIVSAHRVFTFETRDKTDEVVRAFDRATGEPLWRYSWAGSMKVPFFAAKNGSWVRSTPVYDPSTDRLYVGGMREVLVCLQGATGDEVWRVDFVKAFGTPVPDFGFVCSPLIDGDWLYVQAGGAICKVDKHTGAVVWRSQGDGGGMFGSAFSSPVIATLAGQRQLVVQTRTTLMGVDLETGAQLWAKPVRAFRGMNILTPLVAGDRVFTAAYGGSAVCFEVTRQGEGYRVEAVWNRSLQGYMSSPLLIDGHIYLHGRNKRVQCLRLADGKTTWTSKAKFGEYWSMVTNGRKVLALDQTGELVLFRADAGAFELIDRRKVSRQPAWAHVALCGDELFVRDLKGLTAFRWSK